MDRDVVAGKLDVLRHCVQRIRDKCPDDAETLARDLDAQDIVTLNLTRAVQVCVDIGAHIIAGRAIPAPSTMGQTFDLLVDLGWIAPELAQYLKGAVGFRNIAVHNYGAIDWDIVHAIAWHHLRDFEAFARTVDRRIADRSP